MKKSVFLFLLFYFINMNCQTPSFEWVEKLVGNTYTSYGYDCVLDAAGNVYSTGIFNNGLSITQSDLYVSKHNAAGNLLWIRQFPGINAAIGNGRSIVLDNTGNIYVAGYFNRTVDFDPGPNTYNLSSTLSGTIGYNPDIFLVKLNSSGNFVWVKKIGAESVDTCKSMVIDSGNNLILLGTFNNTVDFDPGTSVHNVTAEGNDDIYALKLNSSGSFVWVKTIGTAFTETVGTVGVDAANNVYFSATNGNSVQIAGTGSTVFDIVGAGGMLVKMNPAGEFQWVKDIKGISPNILNVTPAGKVYYAGLFRGNNKDFDPGANTFLLSSANTQLDDGFLSQLDTDGNFVWAKDLDLGTIVYNIKFDSQSKIYLAGYFDGGYTFSGPQTQTANEEGFVGKFNAEGTLEWGTSFKQSNSAQNYTLTQVRGLAIHSNFDVYTTGNFDGNSDFDPSPTASYMFPTIVSSEQGIFINKLSQGFLATGGFVDSSQTIQVVPNPGSGKFLLRSKASLYGASLRVFNILGQQVYMESGIGTDAVLIDLTAKKAGVYTIEIMNAGEKTTKKIVKY